MRIRNFLTILIAISIASLGDLRATGYAALCEDSDLSYPNLFIDKNNDQEAKAYFRGRCKDQGGVAYILLNERSGKEVCGYNTEKCP